MNGYTSGRAREYRGRRRKDRIRWVLARDGERRLSRKWLESGREKTERNNSIRVIPHFKPVVYPSPRRSRPPATAALAASCLPCRASGISETKPWSSTLEKRRAAGKLFSLAAEFITPTIATTYCDYEYDAGLKFSSHHENEAFAYSSSSFAPP
jgi:hypothetical protein